MAHIERRMYRRRRRQARRRLAAALLLTAAAVLAMLILTRRPGFLAQRITTPSPTPVTAAFDRTVATREVTLPAETWYAIQTGVFSTQEAAREKADAYAERGAPGTVVQEGDKWRVFIACYGSEADAATVRQRLGENQRVETYLYRWSCPELRLRLTGMAGQLDVLEAGFALIRQTAERLRDMAILMDAGETTVDEAVQAVGDLNESISLWADTARERFGKQAPEIVQKLLSIADGWNNCRKTIAAAGDSPTALSAALKGQAMMLFKEIIVFRSSVDPKG